MRLFASANEARAFAQQMIDARWRAEVGDFGETAPDAPTISIAEPGAAAGLASSFPRAAVERRVGRA